jgi:uncharacterized protein YkwD
VSPVVSSTLITFVLRLCLPVLLMAGNGFATPSAAQTADAIRVTPRSCAAGQTVTLKWYFTGVRVVVCGGRFGKGADVTGRTTLTDTPRKTTRYTFDVWYPDPKSTANPKTLLHTQYTATAEVGASVKEPTEEEVAYQILEIVNRVRATNKLPPLHLHPQLQAASRWMAQDMAANDYLDHTDHEGRELEGRLAAFDYREYQAIGENVAAGQTTAAEVMESWMQSPGHRSNILNPEFCEIGIGHLANPASKFRHYWAQAFGRQQESFPVVINNGVNRTGRPEVKLYIYGSAAIRQMRLSNDGVTWTAWETYQPERDWTLPTASGKHTVVIELKDGKRTYRSAETIDLVPAKVSALAPVSVRKCEPTLLTLESSDASSHAVLKDE